MHRHLISARLCGLLAGLLGFVAISTAQLAPSGGPGGGPAFFGPPTGVAFDPEPAAVFSGHTLHTGATVSADRKYVHLGVSTAQQAVTGVQNFPVFATGGFASADGSFGRLLAKPPPDPGLKGSSPNPPVLFASSAPLTGVLAKEGMTRLGGLSD